MPTFSIILPCFNATATLAETLDSLRAQTVADWEAICVDDGSTDATRDLIADYARRDARIRLATHAGKGPSAARNAGVFDHANGDIVAFCDADDIWHREKLARVAAMLGDPRIDAVYGRVAFYHGDRSARLRQSTVPDGTLTVRRLLSENPVCTMSNIALRRTVFAGSGGFDERLVHNEDLDWLIRLAGEGARIVGDRSLHILYRTNVGGLSADINAMRAGRQTALATARRYGVRPVRRDEAIFARYLARRALRLDNGAGAAFRFALAGLAQSPRAFLFPLRRGGATALAALVAPIIPRALRRALFAA